MNKGSTTKELRSNPLDCHCLKLPAGVIFFGLVLITLELVQGGLSKET